MKHAKFFVGRNSQDSVSLGNGEVLCCLQQFVDNKAIDWIKGIYFPYFDRDSELLGKEGSFIMCKDRDERIWYDPNAYMRGIEPGEWRGFVSIDNACFVEGTGIYEVCSHKGYNSVRTTTWVPSSSNAIVRKVEVSSHLLSERNIDVYVCADLNCNSNVEKIGTNNIVISRIKNYSEFFIGTLCIDADRVGRGSFVDLVRNDFKSQNAKSSFFVFRKNIRANYGKYGNPVYFIFILGFSKDDILKNAEEILSSKDCFYSETLKSWKSWFVSPPNGLRENKKINYLWNLSQTVPKLCMQKTGEITYAGFEDYVGPVWIRDTIWVATSYAIIGQNRISKLILERLFRIIRKRPDGNFHFNYNCRTGESMEHTYENDSTGLILYSISEYVKHSGEMDFFKRYINLARYCADWICDNADNTGMILACAGIWESFGKATDRKHEHMVWTSGVSAYSMGEIAKLFKITGDVDSYKKYYSASKKLIAAIKKNCIKKGILCRSIETENLDASVLNFFTRMKIFSIKEKFVRNTIDAIEKRLVDRNIGGVWRHEDLTCDTGDGAPWHGCTLWLSEAYYAMGEKRKARKYFQWVLDNATHCGLIPECMLSKEIPRGIPMISYSQAGILDTIRVLKDIL